MAENTKPGPTNVVNRGDVQYSTIEETLYTMKIDETLTAFLTKYPANEEICMKFMMAFKQLANVKLKEVISFLITYNDSRHTKPLWLESAIYRSFRDISLILSLNPHNTHLFWLAEKLPLIWAIFHLTVGMFILNENGVTEEKTTGMVNYTVERNRLPRYFYFLYSFLRWVSDTNRSFGISNWLISPFSDETKSDKLLDYFFSL
jgi:hypothetical protein